MAAPSATPSPEIDAYIDAAPEPARARLRVLRALIRQEAPDAAERMAYGIPTWHQGENLVHLGGFAKHVGLYPGPEALTAFADELTAYPTSKGAVQLPHDRDLPLELVRRIVRSRVVAAAARKAERAASRAPRTRRKG